MLEQLEITKVEVEKEAMADILIKHFGSYAVTVAANIYALMNMLSPDYSEGRWRFYELSNGGFYMVPLELERYKMCWAGNYYEGEMSADAAGITACLFVFSRLSFEPELDFLAEYYHALYDYMDGHEEAGEIMAAID
ncbi:antirestriction protein [Desulfovibrio falkowii]|uniref:Antirestriction protein n=1 Tax=Desulfovibrio falkowii TaxID=3136602 RepID=A0ABQ0E5S1_9BACT